MARVHTDAAAGLRVQRERADNLVADVERLARNSLRWGSESAESLFREVVAQGPEKTLGRGFAVVQTAAGKLLTSAVTASETGSLRLQFQDGTIEAAVIRGKENER